jgi:hypothetical protein
MSGRNPRAHAEEAGSASGGNFHGYLGRNLSDGYRLAVMTLDDQITAAAVLRGATMAAWLAAADDPEEQLDAAFRHRLEADLQPAIRAGKSDDGLAPVALEPLAVALADLNPKLQITLARAFGPWDGRSVVDATDKEAGEALRALRDRLTASDAPAVATGDTEAGLRALYESRDPGAPAPLPLRMRLQQDLGEADAAATQRARLVRASGWRFVFNAFLAVVVLSLVVAVASTVNLRSSAVVAGDPTGDPAMPLTITTVAPIQAAIGSSYVHVGATQRSMIVAFAPSASWRLSSRECQADVVGVVDWLGQTTWIGQQAGHIGTIVGDPSSSNAYVAGLGSYCEVGRFVSGDGGTTWSAGSLPGGQADVPAWLAFDPASAHTLLAYYPGMLYTSHDSGLNWTPRGSTVNPLAFDSTGRLVGWTSGKLFESLDDGLSWQQTGPGPADAPVVAGATSAGILIGAKDGLWWYPRATAATLIQSGAVYSIATLGDGAVVIGASPAGHPWLGTVNSTTPGVSTAPLPADIASIAITGGSVAVNDSGAIVAFTGSSSAIAVASFGR